MPFLVPAIDSWGIALAVVIGCATAYVLLEVAQRIRAGDRVIGLVWWCAGLITLGTGLWAAAFIQLQANMLPFPVAYSGGMLVSAWFCALAAAGVGLFLIGRKAPQITGSLLGCALFGVLLWATDRIAAGAIHLAPEVTWRVAPSLGAIGFGIAATIGLLLAEQWTRRAGGWRLVSARLAVSMIFAIGLAFVSVIAIGAADYPANAACAGINAYEGVLLRDLAAIVVPLLLGGTLMGSVIFGIVDDRRTALAGSLEHVAARLVSANDELRQREMHDPLTQLPNRVLFEDRLAQALLRADREKRSVRGQREKIAVLFVDVDGFKSVNDSFGHAAGDHVIKQIADRLRLATRNEDTVARIGADQFLMLTEGALSSDDCIALASRVLEGMKLPIKIVDRLVQISVSLGIVVYPDHGERNKLLAQAEAAMQAAKRAGRGSYALFESYMHRDSTDQLDLVNDLRQAIDLGQLELHYQPKVDGRRHLICGVEALLRWHHPMRGLVSPASFIPLAERFGLINALGNWVIENACRQMELWAKDGVQMRVAINLSVHQLCEADLVERISSALESHSVNASQLLCEITESVAMQDVTATQRTLDGLGRIGVYLSIDDFGTGYSSLSYLRQLPARQLKIDRTFIKDLDTSDDARAVVDGVVRLAHALGLRVVAEGVETAMQRDILLGLNCDELQGYFFARPMSADKLLAWTLGHKPKGTVDFALSLIRRTVDA